MKHLLTSISLLVLIFILSGCGGNASLQAGSNITTAKEMVAQHRVNEKDSQGNTPLHHAAEKGNIDIAKYLIKHGADLNAQGTYVGTPLHYAVWSDQFEMTKLLVESGANIHARNTNGSHPIHYGASFGRTSFIKYLLSKGANIEAKDNFKSTPLLYAAMNGRLDSVKYLVENNANIEAKNTDGTTPLIWAIAHPKVVEYLLEVGANPTVRDNKGKTAAQNAQTNIQAYANLMQYPVYKKMVDDWKSSERLLSQGSNPQAKKTKEAFNVAELEGTIRSYENFLANYPNSIYSTKAKGEIKRKKDVIKANPQRQKEILKKVQTFLKKKDVDGLMKYANENDDVMEFARNNPSIYLLFTGPKILPVGKILQYKKKGISDNVISSKIKSNNKPYRNYSLDEISTLIDLGMSDTLLQAMLDVTTAYEKENRQYQAQQKMIRQQQKLQRKQSNTSYQPQQNLQQQSGGNTIMQEAGKEVIKGLIKNLF